MAFLQKTRCGLLPAAGETRVNELCPRHVVIHMPAAAAGDDTAVSNDTQTRVHACVDIQEYIRCMQ